MYDALMYSHLFTIIPCIFLGAYTLLINKVNPTHRLVGMIYMTLMVITSIIALFLPAKVGPRWLQHFGYIHLFCVLTLVSIPYSLWQLKRGRIVGHKISMIMLYLGAIGIAGAFTLVPGRFLHTVFFEQ